MSGKRVGPIQGLAVRIGLVLALALAVIVGALTLAGNEGRTRTSPRPKPRSARTTASPSPSPSPHHPGVAERVPGDEVTSIAEISPTDGWAVGIRHWQDRETSLVEHWDGGTWRLVASPNIGVLRSVGASGPENVWTGGDGNQLLHWNGRSWSVFDIPWPRKLGSRILDIDVLGPAEAWASGSVTTRGYRDPCGLKYGGDRPVVLHWNGVEWKIMPTPAPDVHRSALGAIVLVASRDAWAVGSWVTDDGPRCPGGGGGRSRTLIEHWDGRRWRIVRSPNPATSAASGRAWVSDIEALSPKEVWASGAFCPKGACYPMLLRWDGRAWGVAVRTWQGHRDHVVGSMAVFSPADIWLGGTQVEQPILERWDGQTMTAFGGTDLGVGSIGYGGFGIAGISPDDLWAFGPSLRAKRPASSVSGETCEIEIEVPTILHWNGRTWSKLQPAAFPLGCP